MSEGTSKSIEVYAGRVDYQTFGAVDAPETVVLLHASATGAWSLAPLAAQLGAQYRVLVPNLDGYGMSKLDCARCPATFRHVQTVERFLNALEVERFHLVGHSMGGLIALRIARRARFALQSLTLIEPMAFGVLDPVADKGAIDYDRTMINDFLSAIEAGSLEEGLSVFTERVSNQKWDDLTDRARVELMAVIPQIVEEAPLVSCDDLTGHDFSEIDVPTLLIGTENGPPPAAPIIRRIADAIPGAKETHLAGAGHMAPITHAGIVGNTISGFLNRASA